MTLEGECLSRGPFYLILHLSDKRGCAVSYRSDRTLCLSREEGG